MTIAVQEPRKFSKADVMRCKEQVSQIELRGKTGVILQHIVVKALYSVECE